jgi:hypothetical protein
MTDLKNKIIYMDSEPIDSLLVYEMVKEILDFPITDEQWIVIDKAMENYWNRHLPGTIISNEDNASEIYEHCIRERILISYDRIVIITEAIWDSLEILGYLSKS